MYTSINRHSDTMTSNVGSKGVPCTMRFQQIAEKAGASYLTACDGLLRKVGSHAKIEDLIH